MSLRTTSLPPPRSAHAGFDSETGFMAAVQPLLPALRAYGRRLTGNANDSEDLVQDTLVRAWRARERFEPGTNLKAWMIRIERNSFLSGRRRAGRQVDIEPDELDRRLSAPAAQEETLHLQDLDRAIDALPDAQRAAFVGVADGSRYEDLAVRLGVPEGTLKSRVARARWTIIGALDDGRPADARRALPRPAAPSAYETWKRSGSRMIG